MTMKTRMLWLAAVMFGTLGSAGLAAALDDAAAGTVVEGRLTAVRACLSGAAADTHGGITLTALLSGTGTVRQVDVTRRGPHITPEVTRCAATAIRAATFEDATRDTMITIRLLVSESGGAGERVRVRDVVVTEGGPSGRTIGSGDARGSGSGGG